MSSGLLSFPVTDFDDAGDFRADTYARRLEWLLPYGVTMLFAAGGTVDFNRGSDLPPGRDSDRP